MIQSKFNRLWIGLTAGLIGPWIGFLCFYLITYTHKPLSAFALMIFRNSGTHSGVIAVSLVFNLIFFFIALRKDWYYSARGVIFATFIYAPFVIYFKYGA